jgi:hypothetical protein
VQEDFFIELHSILAEREEVTELHPVPDAHVPVMKFKFNGISIDLLYARLSLWAIPDVSFSVNYQRVCICWDANKAEENPGSSRLCFEYVMMERGYLRFST